MGVYLPNKRLPDTYQEVEYIESSGTQYIVIGTSFKTSYKVVIDFQMTLIGGDYIPVGIKYNTTRYGIDAYNSKFMVNGGGQTWVNTISEDTNRHTITIDKGTAIVDGNNYSVSYTNYTFSQGIGVFCYNEYDKSPQYNYKSSNKLYKLDIYDENGNHIHNIVPCYRKSDNVIGLYDLVNNQFYTNSGSGTFTKGSDVVMTELKNAYIGEVPPLVLQQIFDFTTSDLHGFTNTKDPNAAYGLTINTTGHYCTGDGTGGAGGIWKIINASRYWGRIKFQHVNQVYGGVMLGAWAYPVTSDANCMTNYANMSQISMSVNGSDVAQGSYTFSLNTYYYLDCKFDNGLYTLVLSDSNLIALRTLTYQNSDTKWKYAGFGGWGGRNRTSCFRIHGYREAYDNN